MKESNRTRLKKKKKNIERTTSSVNAPAGLFIRIAIDIEVNIALLPDTDTPW